MCKIGSNCHSQKMSSGMKRTLGRKFKAENARRSKCRYANCSKKCRQENCLGYCYRHYYKHCNNHGWNKNFRACANSILADKGFDPTTVDLANAESIIGFPLKYFTLGEMNRRIVKEDQDKYFRNVIDDFRQRRQKDE